MKCDELKEIMLVNQVSGERTPSGTYKKAEVDAAIAELKEKLEDAGMRERRLRRALYKACANWAHHRVFVRFKTNEKAWEKVERKCRAKMEEYK